MIPSLFYYWRQHIATALGTAVTASVLTGALLVGDSVRGSLRSLTLDRLGLVTHAVRSERFFRSSLVDDLAMSLDVACVPVVELNATIMDDATGARVRGVKIYGIDERFGELFDGLALRFDASEDRRPRTVGLNASARAALRVDVGSVVRVSFQGPGEVHRETLFGREEAVRSVETLRLRVVEGGGAGSRFSLQPGQSLPKVGFVSLAGLQRRLTVEGRVNRLLIAGSGRVDAEAIQAALARSVTLADYGLKIAERPGGLSLESERLLLPQVVVDAATTVGERLDTPVLAVSTYLANELRTGNRSVPYSTITALGVLNGRAPNLFQSEDGSAIALPRGDEILLNSWVAERLEIVAGEDVRVAFYHVGPRDELTERHGTFVSGSPVAIEGLAGDRELTPRFPGLYEAEDMAAWVAPFPVDLTQVGSDDESYWDAHEATPKAFVALRKGLSLWQTRHGALSSVRFLGTDGSMANGVSADLLAAVPAGVAGLSVVAPLAEGVSASAGATNFRGLFIGFSLFLIVSSALLTSLLFSLSVERRRGEIGLLLVLGHRPRHVLRRYLGERAVIAALGCGVGVPGAAIYCTAMVNGLSTWWVEAVGTRLLTPHFETTSFVLGIAISEIVTVLTIWVTMRRLVRMPIRELASNVDDGGGPPSQRMWRRTRAGSLVGLVVFLAASAAASAGVRAALFFGVGACALAAGIAAFAIAAGGESRWLSSIALGNAKRHPRRSVLCVSLVACACFVVVAVGANRHSSLSPDHPGTGGFGLVAESDVPIRVDLADRTVLQDLGFDAGAASKISRADVHSLRLKPGEDVSCLNLYRPQAPRILGVGSATIERGRFLFQAVDGDESGNPWRVLGRSYEDGAIPAIADYASATWILHMGIGDDVVILDDRGEPIVLRIAGLLKDSMLQGELLIGEDRFVDAFPSIEGYRFFLIDAGEANAEAIGLAMEQRLGSFGFDTEPAIERLATYKAVENTYMATFQTLGGLGLGLGTIGLGVVMLQNAVDRRREMALMRSVGFRRRKLTRLLLSEGATLLVVGIGIGAVGGAIAVTPHLIAVASGLPFASLAKTLAAILVVGLVSCWVTAGAAMRADLIYVLKSEP